MMKIPSIIFALGCLLVGVHGLALYRFTVRDTENDWFVDGLKNPDLYLTVGETTIFEFTFSGSIPHALRVRDQRTLQYTPDVTNQDNASPSAPINMTWANPQKGNYTYECAYHTSMLGWIEVLEPTPHETAPLAIAPSSPTSTPSSSPSSIPTSPSSNPTSSPSSIPVTSPISTPNSNQPSSPPTAAPTANNPSSGVPDILSLSSLCLLVVLGITLACFA